MCAEFSVPLSNGLATLKWGPLVEGIRRKDSISMEGLYRHFARGLRFFVHRQLGASDAEDTVRDCLATALAAIQQNGLADPERLPTFIYTIIKRQIAELITERANMSGQAVSDLEAELVETGPSPESVASAREVRIVARKVLENMRPIDRAILVRFYVLDERQEQICETLGITAQQFKNGKHRAKTRFSHLCDSAMVPRRKNAGRQTLPSMSQVA